MAEEKKDANGQSCPRFQRRMIFIKKDFQYSYMFLIIISVVLGIAVTVFEVLSALYQISSQYPALLQPFHDKLVPIAVVFGVKIAVYIVLVVLVSAILSNKMAGPVYRFEKTCDEIACGDIGKRVTLRKGDKFQGLQDKFNNMMDVLEAKIKNCKGE